MLIGFSRSRTEVLIRRYRMMVISQTVSSRGKDCNGRQGASLNMTTTKELIGFVRILMLVVIIHHGHLIAQNLSALQVNLGQTPSATLPLDVALKHRISVRNSGSTSLVIDVRTRVI